jgi:molybdopterin converting factor small subunit
VIKVRAEFYSVVKEIVDASAFELSLPKNASVNDLFKQLKRSYPKLRDFEKSILFGIGVEFVDRSYVLNDGDVIAIMPPVQGG